MQIIGLCRFSYPAIGGFQVDHETTRDRIAYLWADERLEERFRLLETVSLPCLRAQTDQKFDLILLIGDTFPRHHVKRLKDLTGDMPQVKIVAHPPRPSRELSKELLNGARRDPSKPCIQFRHDDDDACAIDFIEKMRSAARDVRPLLKKNRVVGFDWNKGYIAQVSAQGISATPNYRPFGTASMGVHIQGDCQMTIHNFMHERIPQHMPCVTFADEDMFVRTHNGFNDSRQKSVKPVSVDKLGTAQEALFRRRFAIDADMVRRVFSAP